MGESNAGRASPDPVNPDPFDYIYQVMVYQGRPEEMSRQELPANAHSWADAQAFLPPILVQPQLNRIQTALAERMMSPEAGTPVDVLVTLTENQTLPPYPAPHWYEAEPRGGIDEAAERQAAGSSQAAEAAVAEAPIAALHAESAPAAALTDAPVSEGGPHLPKPTSRDPAPPADDWLAEVYKLRAGDYDELRARWSQLGGVTVHGGYGVIRALRVTMPPLKVPNLLEISPQIQYIELQHAGEGPPSDPDLEPPDNKLDEDSTDEAISSIQLQWLRDLNLTVGRIALLDTGVLPPPPNSQWAAVLDHVKARYECVTGGPFVEGQHCTLQDTPDRGNHGTRTAAVLTGATTDSDYVGVTTLPVDSFTVYTDQAELDADAAVRAFETVIAAKSKYSVIVAPLQGKRLAHCAISAAADRAFDAGLVVIAANGNTRFTPRSTVGEDHPWWTTSPGNAHKTIGVGAFDITGGQSASAQSYDTDDGRIKPDIQGPTSYRTLPPPDKSAQARFLYETSGATPIVGGAAALLRAWLAGGSVPSHDAGQIYAHLILAGQNVEFWNNSGRDGAGPLLFPQDGRLWWGKVAVEEGETVTISLNPDADLAFIDAACWWPEPATLGPTSAAPAPHNQIILTLVAPDGTTVEGGWPYSVFQRVRVPAPAVTGTWRLYIEGATVPTNPPQVVYWAAYARPTTSATSSQRSLGMSDPPESVSGGKPASGKPARLPLSSTNPAGLTPDWVTLVEGPVRRRTGHALYLQGYVGRADLPNHFRLYRDPSLRSYLEIPTDKLIHGFKEQSELAPLEQAHIWIEADASVISGNAYTTAAYLLDGPISREYGGDSASWTNPTGRPGFAGGGPSFVPGCAPSSGCSSPVCPH